MFELCGDISIVNTQMFVFNLDPCAQKVDLRHLFRVWMLQERF